MSAQSLLTTPLHALHKQQGAKMVPFAGYDMPVQYQLGIMKEHLHVRAHAGVFDVSHMGQVSVSGEGAVAFLEKMLPIDVEVLALNQQKYAMLLNEDGGIIDDLMLVNRANDYLLVINASRKAEDLVHLRQHKPDNVQITELTDRALIALQGPKAVDVLSAINPVVAELKFLQGDFVTLNGSDCYVTRSGYTGEDGYEISVPAQDAEALVTKLIANDGVELIGLGARDSLRLEAGLCLYGNDIDVSKTPLDADLKWVISPSRRETGNKAGGYIGANVIAKQWQAGVSVKRVGLKVNAKVPVRQGADIQNDAGDVIGCVTSGAFAPSLSAPIAMGYIDAKALEKGGALFAIVRNKPVPVEVAALPFVKNNYVK